MHKLSMFFHVIVTMNATCSAGIASASPWMILTKTSATIIEVEYDFPKKSIITLMLLEQFCKKDPECILTFYGGEPLLDANKIKQIMDKVTPKHLYDSNKRLAA